MALLSGDIIRTRVRQTAVFGLFCEYEQQEILVLIPKISSIPKTATVSWLASKTRFSVWD